MPGTGTLENRNSTLNSESEGIIRATQAICSRITDTAGASSAQNADNAAENSSMDPARQNLESDDKQTVHRTPNGNTYLSTYDIKRKTKLECHNERLTQPANTPTNDTV